MVTEGMHVRMHRLRVLRGGWDGVPGRCGLILMYLADTHAPSDHTAFPACPPAGPLPEAATRRGDEHV